MRTVLFIPGYYESINDRDYKAVIKTIESKGYKVKFVPVTWMRTTLKDWLPAFIKTYEKYDAKSTILVGFSFGAVIALCAAARRNPAGLWLFSLSPYFVEDIPKDKRDMYGLGHRRIGAFKEMLSEDLCKSISCPTLVFVGEKEDKSVHGRAIRTNKLLSRSKLIEVPDSKHDVANSNYIKSIKANLDDLP
jgi:pimeloyl-ACP methyl ester carboxylesterase